MIYEQLRGKRCMVLIRVSTGKQEYSADRQRADTQRFASENGMIIVREEVRENFSASVHGHMEVVESVIDEKRKSDDFEVLLAVDHSRLTREGGTEAILQWGKLKEVGILLVTVKEGIIDGPDVWMKLGLYGSANNAYADTFSRNSASGAIKAIKDGRRPHTVITPYGVDRLFLDSQGQPTYILRECANRDLIHINVATGQETRIPNCTGKRTHQWVKQPQERSTFIKGDSERVRIVRQIFTRRFVDQWGAYRIANELNRQGAAAPRDKMGWWLTSVLNVLQNPIYLGKGYANRMATGRYYVRSANGPLPAKPIREANGIAANDPSQKVIWQPREHWIEMDYPDLADVLDEPVRSAAREYQEECMNARWERDARRAKGARRERNRNKHADSPYFLRDVLKMKDGLEKMNGTSIRNKNRTLHYYVPHVQFQRPLGGVSHRLRADVVEGKVKELLKEVLSGTQVPLPALEQIVEQRKKLRENDASRESVLKEKAGIQRKLEVAIENCGAVGRDVLRDKIKSWEARLSALTQRLKAIDAAQQVDRGTAGEIAASVQAQLARLGSDLDQMPPQSLRGLAQALISRMTFDGEAREVEIEMRLPEWALAKQSRLLDMISVNPTSSPYSGVDANTPNGVVLAHFLCQSPKPWAFHPCLTCRRIKKAA